MRHRVVIVAAIATLAGCATTPVAPGDASSAPPAATEGTRCHLPQPVSGWVTHRGSARHVNPVAAKNAAVLAALGEPMRQLGVTVSSEVEDIQMLGASGTSQRIEMRQKVSVAPVEVRDASVTACRVGDLTEVSVATPEGEWARLRRVRRGAALIVLDCQTQPQGGCSDAVKDALRQAATEARLRVTSIVAPPASVSSAVASDLVALGARHETAYILWARLSARFGQTSDGVMYAYTDAAVSLTETSDGKTLQSAALAKVKGAHLRKIARRKYGPPSAIAESLRKAVGGLAAAMRSWPVRQSVPQ